MKKVSLQAAAAHTTALVHCPENRHASDQAMLIVADKLSYIVRLQAVASSSSLISLQYCAALGQSDCITSLRIYRHKCVSD